MNHLIPRASAVALLSALLTACIPPAFYSAVNVYAVDNGNDVSFSVKVANDPASVTCFNGGVTMSWVSGDTWQGIADYTNDLTTRPGQNTVSCSASNSYGSVTSTVGKITLIENQPPNIIMLSGISICGNFESISINEPLVDMGSSTYMTGATYALTQGTLPAGLSINSANGNLIGTPATGDHNINGLKMTATTLAGSDESGVFSVSITDDACPP